MLRNPHSKPIQFQRGDWNRDGIEDFMLTENDDREIRERNELFSKLPPIIQKYDKNQNGNLENSELVDLLMDYDFQVRDKK